MTVEIRRIYYSFLIIMITVLTVKIMIDMRVENRVPTVYDKHDIDIDYGQN